jgi:predicted TIM-barrel fold metal-dependent hydrolase
MDPAQWRETLTHYANRLRRLNWILQVYVAMNQIVEIADVIPTLGVRVVFDHLGCPNPGVRPMDQPGCRELYRLLSENKDIYIKMSAGYRFDAAPDLDGHIQNLLRIVPNQVVWASDWPHTGGMKHNPGGDPHREQEFLTPDIPGFLERCTKLCNGDKSLIRKVWVDNPQRLWS